MALRTIANTSSLLRDMLFNCTRGRYVHTSGIRLGADSRDKREGHLKKTDTVEGEHGALAASIQSYELIDEHLLDSDFKKAPIVYIKCTRNNTKVTLVRGNGDIVAVKSAGTEGYKNCRKGTTVAAQAVANRVLTIAADNDITTARMVFNGLGPGRNAAYKVFELSNMNIISLSDRTQAAEPYNMRPRKAKRI